VRTALIGAGQIAREHLSCLATLDDVEVAGVCDLSPAVAEATAERHRVPAWFTDHRLMLAELRPDVVHVTTPPTSHHALGIDALQAGAHVIVEKPATATLEELEDLVDRATTLDRVLLEDYNYIFNHSLEAISERVEAGDFGAVVHVDVMVCLDILGPLGFADPNARHPILSLRGGAVSDFLPHLASIAHHFLGPHQEAYPIWSKRSATVLPYDEFHALVGFGRGTAHLGFSASAQADGFWVRVHGERMQATTNLWDERLTYDGLRPGPRQLRPLLNGLDEARAVRGAAIRGFLGKFGGGPGTYDGLWEFIRRTYDALGSGSTPPFTRGDILAVNRLVDALKPVAEVPA
jgi:predicted dehydrogenase